jgi:hypothetical protein
LHVNGAPVGQPFEGFNPGPFPAEVIHSGPVLLGSARLEAGQNQLVFEILCKHGNSTGFMVGIDYLRFVPVLSDKQ